MDLALRNAKVKVWGAEDAVFGLKQTITSTVSVTTVDFLQTLVGGQLYLAFGTEAGGINVYRSGLEDLAFTNLLVFDPRFVVPPDGQVLVRCLHLRYSIVPSKAVTQLSWRQQRLALKPNANNAENGAIVAQTAVTYELAASSEDSSLRIYSISNL
jgi:hypothetical protein